MATSGIQQNTREGTSKQIQRYVPFGSGLEAGSDVGASFSGWKIRMGVSLAKLTNSCILTARFMRACGWKHRNNTRTTVHNTGLQLFNGTKQIKQLLNGVKHSFYSVLIKEAVNSGLPT